MTTINRNDPCPCGSGKKYKHCCQAKDAAQAAKARADRAFIPGTLQMAIGHHQSGRMSLAKTLYQQILQADPAHADALHLLGLIEHHQGNSDKAIELIGQAIEDRPTDANFHFNLGNLHQDLGQLDEAIVCFQQALVFQPNAVNTLLGLGTALKAKGQMDEAMACFGAVLARQPDHADAHYNLGNALQMLGQRNDAISHYRQALALKPNIAGLHSNLGNALHSQGRLDEAITHYRQALVFEPESASVHSNLLLTLQNLETCSAEALFQEHLRYAQSFEAPLKPFWQPHRNPRDPARRLKLGYVSGDFRRHVVANFFEPILACHDKLQFELFGYHNNTQHDSYTERIAAKMDHFVPCIHLSDDELAECIRADGIDILVDLSGHTSENRLPVFARKPAPVQVNYIGYPGTTGLSAMDYRISDPWQDPVGLTERYHSEALVRLPGGMAFLPELEAPGVNALPALTSGELVFASLNNLSKVNPAVIKLWARILKALPQARLMLGNVTDSGIKERLTSLFDDVGVGSERLILQPRLSVADYLALHHQIDLALDPFPYNGGTTTMHSLWMGVPVITLAGDHAVSRLCAAHLSRVGLDAFITHSEDEYLQCAIRFANDLPKLNEVRQSVRARMSAPECQPAAITRQLEAAYRDMWHTWCNP